MARHYRFFLRNPDTFPLIQHKDDFRLTDILEPEVIFQLVKVLRVKPGDMVVLVPRLLEAGAAFHEYVFEVTSADKHGVELVKKETRPNTNELGFDLNLWLCLPNKPEKLEFILQKAVEIGATSVILFEGDFSQMKHQLRHDRLEKIIVEASEQSERAVVPTLVVKGNLGKALSQMDASGLGSAWVALERSSKRSERSGNPFWGSDTSKGLSLLIGPEGGFSDAEKKLFQEMGLRTFSLGKRVLRMETAAVISLGLAALLEE